MIKPVIFTRGRIDNQVTLNNMPPEIQQETTLLVYPEEYNSHKEKYNSVCNVVSCPDDIHGIAARREWAAKNLTTGLIQWQLDDDLSFCKAKKDNLDGSWPFIKFDNVSEEDWKDLFKDIQTACDIGFKVGGLGQRISPRGICDFPGLINSRVYTNTWYDFRTIDPSGYDWTGKDWKEDEFLPEDFHIQCQTVQQGIPVLNFNKWATSGNKTQATGGCASSRTLDNHNKGMERFAQVWNQCSTLRWKDSWEKDKKKAALTIRLGKLWPKEKEILANMEEDLRKELGAHPKKIARELQKKADALRKAKESSNLENFF